MTVVTSRLAAAPEIGPIILAQSAVPLGLLPSGTVAADGTITLATALPTTYSGGMWGRLPAGAVVGGAAGLYWIVFSSTAVGAVKTSFADPAAPFGGWKQSGVGREGSHDGLLEYLESKYIAVTWSGIL